MWRCKNGCPIESVRRVDTEETYWEYSFKLNDKDLADANIESRENGETTEVGVLYCPRCLQNDVYWKEEESDKVS